MYVLTRQPNGGQRGEFSVVGVLRTGVSPKPWLEQLQTALNLGIEVPARAARMVPAAVTDQLKAAVPGRESAELVPAPRVVGPAVTCSRGLGRGVRARTRCA